MTDQKAVPAQDAVHDTVNSIDHLDSTDNPRNLNKTLLVPLFVFLSLVAILAIGFQLEDPHKLPSVLIDRPFPEFAMRELHDAQRTVTQNDFKGEVSLVNVWATWCPNCVMEHPQLTAIAASGVPLYGINYNDVDEKAKGWLQRYGNPFTFNIVDDEGKLGIDLGVYGAPETFVLDKDGVIQYKHIGEVTQRDWMMTIKPLIEQLEHDS